MENKWLTIQSFERNQNLLELINKLLIHLKLHSKGIDDRMNPEEVLDAKKALILFLTKLDSLVHSIEKKSDPLTGIDLRYRKLIRNFVDAKNRTSKFKSSLFRNSPGKVLELINSSKQEDVIQLIDSLTELRALLDDHIAFDTKDLIGEI